MDCQDTCPTEVQPSEFKDELEELYELRQWLKLLLNKDYLQELVVLAELIDKSYVDSYNRIKENSKFGKDCGYAVKAKDLYSRLQSKPIDKKIEYIYKTFIASH